VSINRWLCRLNNMNKLFLGNRLLQVFASTNAIALYPCSQYLFDLRNRAVACRVSI